MAYTANTLSDFGHLIGGRSRMWIYNTADQMDVVLSSGYISDAGKKRMQVGDLVFVFSAALNTSLTAAPTLVAAGVVSEFASAPLWQPCVVSSISATTTPGVPLQSATATLTPVSLPAPASALANFRNLLDGGDFTVNPWQRGTSFTGITTGPTYGADRWFAAGGASSSISMSQQAQTDVVGFSKSLRFGRGGGTNTATINLGQVLETADSIRAQGQSITLSFWAKAGAQFSAANSALTVQVISGTGADQSASNLVAGSWPGQTSLVLTPGQGSATPAASIAQPITTAPVRYVFTGVVPATCTQLGVLLSYAPTGTNNTTDTVDFYGVQLEIGPEATVFEHRDVQVELEICQRYFWQINEPQANGVVLGIGQASTTTVATIQINLPVQMRAAPNPVSVTKGSIGITVAAGTNQALTTLAANAAGHTVNAIGLTATASAANLVAGNATQLISNTGVGVISASADY